MAKKSSKHEKAGNARPKASHDQQNLNILDFNPKRNVHSPFDKMSISPEKMDLIIPTVILLAKAGVTPEIYQQLYEIVQVTQEVMDLNYSDDEDDFDSADLADGIFFGNRPRCASPVKEYKPLVDAENYSLVLKVQMAHVAKPPMWREIEVPAHFDFMRLHETIQVAVGLEDDHLWCFNKKAYDDSLLIACECDDPYAEDPTHEAEETPITLFLQKKGDKLEYVYDYGDNWIFTIEVKDLLAKRSESPVCRKHKSDLNAIEDFGGPWEYCNARADLENWDNMTDKERSIAANNHNFDSLDEYIFYLKSHLFYPGLVNDALSEIQK